MSHGNKIKYFIWENIKKAQKQRDWKYSRLNKDKQKEKIIIMVVVTLDKLPRVPDAHGDVVDEKIFSDLYIRTSWVDANVALDQINKVIIQLLVLYCLRV